jgi:hypothetical protein
MKLFFAVVFALPLAAVGFALNLRKCPRCSVHRAAAPLGASRSGESDISELQSLWNSQEGGEKKLMSPIDELERLYGKFAREVLGLVDYESGAEEFTCTEFDDVYGFNSVAASRLHSETVFALIKSDVQNRKDDDDEMRLVTRKQFPPTYSLTLQFLADVLVAVEEHPEFAPIYKILKFIVLKEGLKLGGGAVSTKTKTKAMTMSVREIVEVKRKAERCVSLVMLLCITYRAVCTTNTGNSGSGNASGSSSGNGEAESDFLYFVKPMAERLPVQDKHFALLLLCRGILHPSYYLSSLSSSSGGGGGGGGDNEKLLDAQSVVRSPLAGLRESFVNGMKQAGVSQPGVAAKMLYPFAAVVLRCYQVVNDDEPFSVAAAQEASDLFAAYTGDDDTTPSGASAASAVSGTTAGGSGTHYPPGGSTGGYNCPPDSVGGGGVYTALEPRLCAMLRDCRDIDDAARRSNGLEEAGAELLTSLRRWLIDRTAVHFINDVDLQMRAADETFYPQEITRNTVAMELVSTSGAFVFGRRKQRLAYVAHLATLGKKMEVVLSAFEAWQPPTSTEITHTEGEGDGEEEEYVDFSDGSGGDGTSTQDDDDIERASIMTSAAPVTAAAFGRSLGLGVANPNLIYAALQEAELSGDSRWTHPLSNVKKLMAVMGIMEYVVPVGDPLSRQFDRHFELSLLGELHVSQGAKRDARGDAATETLVSAKLTKMKRKMAAAQGLAPGSVGKNSGGRGGGGGDLWGGSSSGATVVFGSSDSRAADRKAFYYPSSNGGTAATPARERNGPNGGKEEYSDGGFWANVRSLGKGRGRKKLELQGGGGDGGRPVGEVIHSFLMRALVPVLDVDTTTARYVDSSSSSSSSSSLIASEVSYIFMHWRAPHLLLDYYRIHNTGTSSGGNSNELLVHYKRFLRALFGASGESTDQIRTCDPANRRHLERFPPEVVQAWVNGCTDIGETLPGFADAQTLFMLGEDASTCMMIKSRQRSTNRALLSFLLHGNVRVVGTKDAAGRLRTRSVVKLLIDESTRRPVIYAESPIHSAKGSKDAAVLEVYDQVAELGRLLGVPVVYAKGPDPASYIRSEFELDAVSLDGAYFQATGAGAGRSSPSTNDDDNDDVLAPVTIRKEDFCRLVDYSAMAPNVWVDGILDPVSGRFVDGLTPILLKRWDAAVAEPLQLSVDSDGGSAVADDAAAQYDDDKFPGYYTNGYRLPSSLESLYAQVPSRELRLPDYTCRQGKAGAYFSGMEWQQPPSAAATAINSDNALNQQQSSAKTKTKTKAKKTQSRQEMLAMRQAMIDKMSGRSERVLLEKEQARDMREKQQGGWVNGRGEVVAPAVGEEEEGMGTRGKEGEEEGLHLEEGAGLFDDDTDDLW